MQENEYNFDLICRWCLAEQSEMKELFNLKISGENKANLVEFMRSVTGLKITKDDGLPENTCSNCLGQIENTFKFVQVCVETDTVLRQQRNRKVLENIQKDIFETDNNKIEEQETLEIKFEGGTITDNEYYNDISDEEPQHEIIINKFKSDKYKCKTCSESFSNKIKYCSHLKTHEGKPFKCTECLQTYSKKTYLNVHLRSHIKSENKPFSCGDCGRQFNFEYLLKQHEYKHSDLKPFPCEKCNKGCLTAESLRRHMRTHEKNYKKKTHECRTCHKEFAFPSFLVEHMKIHTGEKPHLCSICGKGFRQAGALHYHQRIHSGVKPFSCHICEASCLSQSILKVHIRKHTNERPYICDICGVAFRQSTDLRAHSRMHSGEKSVLCTVCGKRMSSTGQLTVHLRSHTGEKPFRCTSCGKSFTTNTMLVKHNRIHTGEKPYVCDICGKAFNQSSTLKTHKQVHFNEKKSLKNKNRAGELKLSKKLNLLKEKQQIIEEVGVYNSNDSTTDNTAVIYKQDSIEIIAEEQIVSIENEKGDSINEFTVILPAPIPSL